MLLANLHAGANERQILLEMHAAGQVPPAASLPSGGGAERRRRTTPAGAVPTQMQRNGLPVMHSQVGATYTIFLDFDGYVHVKDPAHAGFESFVAQP